ncbi:MAG: hypothetical protein WC867_00565 [Candidatus Pacearchaeota archaeon]|jgi:uncharacterized membrane protein YgcG
MVEISERIANVTKPEYLVWGDNYDKKKDKKKIYKILAYLAIIAALIIFFRFALLAYLYIANLPKINSYDANIERIALSDDGTQAYIKLTGGNSKEIESIKFIFRSNESEYVFETRDGIKEISYERINSFLSYFANPSYEGSYDYSIKASDINLVSFRDIIKVEVSIKYKDENTGEVKETKSIDSSNKVDINVVRSGGYSGGGSGGSGSSGGGSGTSGNNPGTSGSFGNNPSNYSNETNKYVLEKISNVYAAYSLRRLTRNYTGPLIEVRRTSDLHSMNITFDSSGQLEIISLLNFVGNSNGEVIRWYSQNPDDSSLVIESSINAPLIVKDGVLIVDSKNRPAISFYGDDDCLVVESKGLKNSINTNNLSVFIVVESNSTGTFLGLAEPGTYDTLNGIAFIADPQDNYWIRSWFSDGLRLEYRAPVEWEKSIISWNSNKTSGSLYKGYQKVDSFEGGGLFDLTLGYKPRFVMGADSKNMIGSWKGYVSELIISDNKDKENHLKIIEDLDIYWNLAQKNYNKYALLYQKYQYHVDLYNWLETISISDLDLPNGKLSWDGYYSNIDNLADIWIFFTPYKSSSLSRVTRQESKWLVLNDGSGSGIEATGQVRLLHSNEDGQKSWGNEPAYWYEVSLPLSNGSNGNPYYKHTSLCNRALVITAVDMIMYDKEIDKNGYATWNDMHGKALLSWVDSVYACKDEIDAEILNAFEDGFKKHLLLSIKTGVRDANTNMDMFSVEAAAKIAKKTNDLVLKDVSLRAAKKLLLGYEDAVLFTYHNPNLGSFFPAGYIGENDMADGFYNGESFYHITGAYSYIYDEPGWEFFKEVLKRMSEWRIYQAFNDPAFSAESGSSIINSSRFDGAAGYSGRTGASALIGQQSVFWRDITAADMVYEARPLANSLSYGTFSLASNSQMVNDINNKITSLNSLAGVVDTTSAPLWSGWSPWPKVYPYKPPSGWYTRLDSIKTDSSTVIPILRQNSYSKAMGGEPTGIEFWSYKNYNGANDFGWFVEADSNQGNYGGWYGGKLELFWTKKTGIIILNRHGKTGCNSADMEDSKCWVKIEKWGAHHVWGKDENDKAFSQVHLKGNNINRDTIAIPENSPQYIEITNNFNDINATSGSTGEETGNELTGSFNLTNRFEALTNGIKIIHNIKSDESDQIKELWLTIPVYLGDSQYTRNQPNTSIEYYSNGNWLNLDTNLVLTEKIRLGRNFLTGDGIQFVYIQFSEQQKVKLSSSAYIDPYQTKTILRNIHVDLHGNPGVVIPTPKNKFISYEIMINE